MSFNSLIHILKIAAPLKLERTSRNKASSWGCTKLAYFSFTEISINYGSSIVYIVLIGAFFSLLENKNSCSSYFTEMLAVSLGDAW